MRAGFFNSTARATQGALQDPRSVQMTIETQSGNQRKTHLPPAASIGVWKATIARVTRVPEQLFELAFNGTVLEETKKASAYDIPSDGKLVMVSKARSTDRTSALPVSRKIRKGDIATPAHNLSSDGIPAPKRCLDEDGLSTALPSEGSDGAADVVSLRPVEKLNRRERKQRAAARLAGATSEDKDACGEGSVFTVQEDGSIYKSSASWTQIGSVSAGEKIVAAGPIEVAGEWPMVPVKPHGAVEFRILTHESEMEFSVTVRTRKGTKTEVNVRNDTSIETLKTIVSDATRVPLSLLHLTSSGELMREGRQVCEYGVCEGSELLIGRQ